MWLIRCRLIKKISPLALTQLLIVKYFRDGSRRELSSRDEPVESERGVVDVDVDDVDDVDDHVEL